MTIGEMIEKERKDNFLNPLTETEWRFLEHLLRKALLFDREYKQEDFADVLAALREVVEECITWEVPQTDGEGSFTKDTALGRAWLILDRYHVNLPPSRFQQLMKSTTQLKS